MNEYRPHVTGNGEVNCPSLGCPTGLQRDAAGCIRSGVLAHLRTVHHAGMAVEVLATKYRVQLDRIEEAVNSH